MERTAQEMTLREIQYPQWIIQRVRFIPSSKERKEGIEPFPGISEESQRIRREKES